MTEIDEESLKLLACNLETAWRAWLGGCNIATEYRLRKIEKPSLEFLSLADAFASTHRANHKATIASAASIVRGDNAKSD